ncbi:MAG: polysaccharide deacetylase family protein [Chitinophagaceae bacterium]|nr:polysaccharide deacetylase family protein [Chitinophagaceae bacterium]
MKNGNFVISLDFEIYWGVWDVVKLENYSNHLHGVRQVIPGLLNLFSKYNIEATFATVGFLFFENKEQLLQNIPKEKPSYTNKKISPYESHLHLVGNNEADDPVHFAPTLLKLIKEAKQEVGCHTFSHYYCLEDGQTVEEFRQDLQAAKAIAKQLGVELKSFIFPRNQYNETYLATCKQEGIIAYRGNENSWLYEAKNYESETYLRRALRLADAYINLTGHHCHDVKWQNENEPCNIPASRFLRQYKKGSAFLEGLRLQRIKKSMTHAARKGLTYHLWWHPHNFGVNLKENLSFLEEILKHYQLLQSKYNFKSTNMQNLAQASRK